MTKRDYKAAIYVRTATKEQTSGTSLKSQENICKEYANNNGLNVIRTYKDCGISGLSEQRSALSQLMKYCKKGKIKRVVMFDETRLARNINLYDLLLNKFKSLGTKLLYVNGTKYAVYSRVSSAQQLADNKS